MSFKRLGYATKLDTMLTLHRVLPNGNLGAILKVEKHVRFFFLSFNSYVHILDLEMVTMNDTTSEKMQLLINLTILIV